MYLLYIYRTRSWFMINLSCFFVVLFWNYNASTTLSARYHANLYSKINECLRKLKVTLIFKAWASSSTIAQHQIFRVIIMLWMLLYQVLECVPGKSVRFLLNHSFLVLPVPTNNYGVCQPFSSPLVRIIWYRLWYQFHLRMLTQAYDNQPSFLPKLKAAELELPKRNKA